MGPPHRRGAALELARSDASEQLPGRLETANTPASAARQELSEREANRLVIDRALDPFVDRSRQSRSQAEGLAVILDAYRVAAVTWADRAHMRLGDELLLRPMSQAEIHAWLRSRLDEFLVPLLRTPVHADVAEHRGAVTAEAFWARLHRLTEQPEHLVGGRA